MGGGSLELGEWGEMQRDQEETVGWEGSLLNGKGEREIWDQAIPDQSHLPCAALNSSLPHFFNPPGRSMLLPLPMVSPFLVQRGSH